MTQLTPYLFGEKTVRVIQDHKSEPWFVAKDVALALGYQWKGTGNISHIPAEWRGVYSVQTPSGEQEMLTLSEQGLYFFLGRSDKPAALPFQRWLAGEVLPALRRTGRYALPKAELPKNVHQLEDLPEDILALPPKRRERYFELALQALRVTGEGNLRQTFLALCRGLGAPGLQHGAQEFNAHLPQFIQDRCERGPWRVTTAQLWPAYNDWCRETGLAPAGVLSMKRFARLLLDHAGCRLLYARPRLVLEGLRLKEGQRPAQ